VAFARDAHAALQLTLRLDGAKTERLEEDPEIVA